jgi:hypothetical protein
MPKPPTQRRVATAVTGAEPSGRRLGTGRRAANGNDPQKVMPRALDTHFDDIGPKVVGSPVQFVHFASGRDATAMSRKTSTEHVGDQHQLRLFTDRAVDTRGVTNEACGSNEFGMCVAYLMLCQSPTTELVDEVLTRQAMVDNRGTAATQLRGAEPVVRTLR